MKISLITITPTPSVQPNPLDTITKHLIDINHQLMKIRIEDDTTKTVTILVAACAPLLAGFMIFWFNRNKEFRLERAKLAGQIHLLITDYKSCFTKCCYSEIEYLKVRRMDYLFEDDVWLFQDYQEYQEDYNSNTSTFVQFKESLALDVKTKEGELFTIKKELNKVLGQYKFYLGEEQRKEFVATIDGVKHIEVPNYYYLDCNTLTECYGRYNEWNRNAREVIQEKCSNVLESIEKQIDATID